MRAYSQGFKEQDPFSGIEVTKQQDTKKFEVTIRAIGTFYFLPSCDFIRK